MLGKGRLGNQCARIHGHRLAPKHAGNQSLQSSSQMPSLERFGLAQGFIYGPQARGNLKYISPSARLATGEINERLSHTLVARLASGNSKGKC